MVKKSLVWTFLFIVKTYFTVGGRKLNSLANCTPRAINQFPQGLFTQKQRAGGTIILHILVATYMFAAFAYICEDYFVPSLEILCDGRREREREREREEREREREFILCLWSIRCMQAYLLIYNNLSSKVIIIDEIHRVIHYLILHFVSKWFLHLVY